MADINAALTTDDPKSGWHSWIINSPKHSSKQDRPEREVIAFATGFEMLNEPEKVNEMGSVLQWIIKCLLPLLIVLSVVANIIIMKVMHIISQWKFPPCLYVVILSAIDLTVNTVKLIDYWCQVAFSIRFLSTLSLTSEALCSTLTISIYFLCHLTSMIRSALCIDLYYSFKCPLANNKKVIVCRIEHLILLFISVLLIFNSHFLWTYSLIQMNHKQSLVPPGNYCTYLVKWVSPTFRDVLWPVVDILIGEICPIVSVLVSTVLIRIRTPDQLCSLQTICSPLKEGQLRRYMIDVCAFKDMRKFLLIYNVIYLLLILIPSTVAVIYKGMTYQRNHAMKIVSTFSTARSSTRSYINPVDVYIINTVNQVAIVIYPIIIVVLGWRFSQNGFKKEMLSLFSKTNNGIKVHFII